MRLTIRTWLDPKRGLFIDKPGTIYGSGGSNEPLARSLLSMITDFYDEIKQESQKAVEDYQAEMAEFEKKHEKWSQTSKRRNAMLGRKEPTAPDKPMVAEVPVKKFAKEVVCGENDRWQGVTLDMYTRGRGGKTFVSCTIRVCKPPKLSDFNVREANNFNAEHGLNWHVHFIGEDFARVYREIFKNEASRFSGKVELIDECPIVGTREAFDEFINRKFNQFDEEAKERKQ